MEILSIEAARADLGSLVDRADDGEPTMILRHSTPKAVVVGWREYQKMTVALQTVDAAIASRGTVAAIVGPAGSGA